MVKITYTAFYKFSVQFCALHLTFCSRLLCELMAITNITQKIAEGGVFVAISWKFCVAKILTAVHKSCDKGLYASYGECYIL